MWVQMAPPQNALANKVPRTDVRGISRRTAVRTAPAPTNRTCSPRPYFARASGGTNPRIFCDPVKIISPPIRTCRVSPAILAQFLRSFIALLLWSAPLHDSSFPPDDREPRLQAALG